MLFDDVRHVFGVFLESGDDMTTFPHLFEGGITAHVLNVGNMEEAPLAGITIDYRQPSCPVEFHFDGIDGTFALRDVVEHFDNLEPHNIRTGYDEERLGAVQSYGYFAFEKRFVRFFFDDEDSVVAINFWVQ